MNDEERAGVEAIVALQKMAGIDEPEDAALKSWRGFSPIQRAMTMDAYGMAKRFLEYNPGGSVEVDLD